MKKFIKLLLVIVSLAVLVCGGLLGYSYYAVSTAICVIRVEYNGFNNIGHIPNEYYALRDGAKLRIPGVAARLFLGNGIRDDIGCDPETEYWDAYLVYAADGETFYDPELLAPRLYEVAHGEKYRLAYEWWTHTSSDPDDSAVAIMVRAAEQLHDGDVNNWIYSEKKGGLGLLGIMLARKGDTDILVINERQRYSILLTQDDGTYTVLYEEPENGVLSYLLVR